MDLESKKLEKQDMLEFRSKMNQTLEQKANFNEIQEFLQSQQKDIATSLFELREELR